MRLRIVSLVLGVTLVASACVGGDEPTSVVMLDEPVAAPENLPYQPLAAELTAPANAEPADDVFVANTRFCAEADVLVQELLAADSQRAIAESKALVRALLPQDLRSAFDNTTAEPLLMYKNASDVDEYSETHCGYPLMQYQFAIRWRCQVEGATPCPDPREGTNAVPPLIESLPAVTAASGLALDWASTVELVTGQPMAPAEPAPPTETNPEPPADSEGAGITLNIGDDAAQNGEG